MERLIKELLNENPNHIYSGDMTKEEWLEVRRKSIGGSDAGAIMGLNKWASPLTVYLDKKGLNTFEGNTATERGSWLEAPIRERCREELGIPIAEVPHMFYSEENPFMSANIDGVLYIQDKKIIAGVEVCGFGGHEIKTSQRGTDFTATEVPDTYYVQVQHYMAVIGLQFFILSAYLIEKNELRHYVIKRDEYFISRLIETEKDFWEKFVQKDIMPAPSGIDEENDLIIDMFEGDTTELILDDEAESLCAEYLLLNEQIKDLETRKKQVSTSVKLKVIAQQNGSNDHKAKAVAGNYRISFSKFTRKSIDTDRLKKEGLYDKYAKESESSMFRISEPKAKGGA